MLWGWEGVGGGGGRGRGVGGGGGGRGRGGRWEGAGGGGRGRAARSDALTTGAAFHPVWQHGQHVQPPQLPHDEARLQHPEHELEPAAGLQDTKHTQGAYSFIYLFVYLFI